VPLIFEKSNGCGCGGDSNHLMT